MKGRVVAWYVMLPSHLAGKRLKNKPECHVPCITAIRGDAAAVFDIPNSPTSLMQSQHRVWQKLPWKRMRKLPSQNDLKLQHQHPAPHKPADDSFCRRCNCEMHTLYQGTLSCPFCGETSTTAGLDCSDLSDRPVASTKRMRSCPTVAELGAASQGNVANDWRNVDTANPNVGSLREVQPVPQMNSQTPKAARRPEQTNQSQKEDDYRKGFRVGYGRGFMAGNWSCYNVMQLRLMNAIALHSRYAI